MPVLSSSLIPDLLLPSFKQLLEAHRGETSIHANCVADFPWALLIDNSRQYGSACFFRTREEAKAFRDCLGNAIGSNPDGRWSPAIFQTEQLPDISCFLSANSAFYVPYEIGRQIPTGNPLPAVTTRPQLALKEKAIPTAPPTPTREPVTKVEVPNSLLINRVKVSPQIREAMTMFLRELLDIMHLSGLETSAADRKAKSTLFCASKCSAAQNNQSRFHVEISLPRSASYARFEIFIKNFEDSLPFGDRVYGLLARLSDKPIPPSNAKLRYINNNSRKKEPEDRVIRVWFEEGAN